MATITSKVGDRTMSHQLQSLFSTLHDALNGFASNRLRHAAAAAEHLPFRQGVPSGLSAEQVGAAGVRLAPPDPEVLSESIPAFFIGRNRAGLWVAREAKGRAGGLFLLKSSALAFARAPSSGSCALIFPTERFELDLPNAGNPLATQLRRLVRLLPGL
ncbi:MAG: hypothetical protein WA418_34170 [Bradyrhizobium sp.]